MRFFIPDNSKSKIVIIISLGIYLFINACGLYRTVDTREVPIRGEERAKKNVAEGKGLTIRGLAGGGKTNYEFSTSNPMWRATLEVLDFLPLSTVDYSGGLIITDWYSDASKGDDSLKITVRFLSNEVQSNSLKVIVHKKKCFDVNKCEVNLLQSKISEELTRTIISKAAEIDKNTKSKKN